MITPNLSPKSILSYVVSRLSGHAVKESLADIQASLEAIDAAAAQYAATLSPVTIAKLNGRFEQGVGLARLDGVSPLRDPIRPEAQRLYRVRSSNPTHSPYLVDLEAETCECPDHWKGYFCKHRIAAHIYETAYPPSLGNGEQQDLTQVDIAEPDAVQEPDLAVHNSNDPQPDAQFHQQKESIIWAVIHHDDKLLGVEVLSLEGGQATVRALPKVIDGKKLQPQFPFAGKHCTTTVPQQELSHVTVFQ